MDDWQTSLIEAAEEARKRAYAPYSRISVGAALLSNEAHLTEGCNMENASYSATICAERVALARALYVGERGLCAIAIVGGPLGEDPTEYFYPCGICRQWMAEFCGPNFLVIAAKNAGDYQTMTLAELLPHSFGPGHIGS